MLKWHVNIFQEEIFMFYISQEQQTQSYYYKRTILWSCNFAEAFIKPISPGFPRLFDTRHMMEKDWLEQFKK